MEFYRIGDFHPWKVDYRKFKEGIVTFWKIFEIDVGVT